MDPEEQSKNAAFFNSTNKSLGEPGNEDSEEMVKDLLPTEEEEQEIEDKRPQEIEYIIQEPGQVLEEELDNQKIDSEKVDEEGKEVVLPVIDPQFAKIAQSLETLTDIQKRQIESNQQQQQQQQIDQDPEPEMDPMEAQSVKDWQAWNMRRSDNQVKTTLEKYHNENVLPIQNIALNREIDSQKSECKTQFGDRFDFDRDKVAIQEIQMRFPGVSMADAFRNIDYARMEEDNKTKAEGKKELANTQTVDSGVASRTVAKNLNRIVLEPSEEDKAYAKNFDMPIKQYMQDKYEGEKSGGEILL